MDTRVHESTLESWDPRVLKITKISNLKNFSPFDTRCANFSLKLDQNFLNLDSIKKMGGTCRKAWENMPQAVKNS